MCVIVDVNVKVCVCVSGWVLNSASPWTIITTEPARSKTLEKLHTEPGNWSHIKAGSYSFIVKINLEKDGMEGGPKMGATAGSREKRV